MVDIKDVLEKHLHWLRGDCEGWQDMMADLSGANLSGANIDNEIRDKIFPICCPEYGSFIGWKKAQGYIVKLEIQENAKRSSAYDRKCRCSSAKVLAIEHVDGTPSGLHKIESDYDPDFVYEVGETVTVYNFDEDRWNRCSTGIHFFITRKEAEYY